MHDNIHRIEDQGIRRNIGQYRVDVPKILKNDISETKINYNTTKKLKNRILD